MSDKDIPTKSRHQVKGRAKGRCERCGGWGSDWHHRRTRSVRDDHRHCACNGLWLCRTCHSQVHADPARSRENGWIVSRYAEPWLITYRRFDGSSVQNTCDGGWSFGTETF